jgi:hypothetical protein
MTRKSQTKNEQNGEYNQINIKNELAVMKRVMKTSGGLSNVFI